jgi:hypothetical protein
MTLATGTKLGPYESLAPLGAGGMGKCIVPATRGRAVLNWPHLVQ